MYFLNVTGFDSAQPDNLIEEKQLINFNLNACHPEQCHPERSRRDSLRKNQNE